MQNRFLPALLLFCLAFTGCAQFSGIAALDTVGGLPEMTEPDLGEE